MINLQLIMEFSYIETIMGISYELDQYYYKSTREAQKNVEKCRNMT